MNIIFVIVLFLLTYAASPAVVAQGRPSFGTFGSSHATPPRQEARARQVQRTKETAMSMLQKFQERLDRYEEFLVKVESRKQKLADKGSDVTKMTAFLATARTNLASARSALSAARTGMNAIDYTGTPQAIRTAIRTQLNTVRQAMQKLHTSMSETVREARHATESGANTTHPSPSISPPERLTGPGTNSIHMNPEALLEYARQAALHATAGGGRR